MNLAKYSMTYNIITVSAVPRASAVDAYYDRLFLELGDSKSIASSGLLDSHFAPIVVTTILLFHGESYS